MASHRQKLAWWSDYRCDRGNLAELNLNGRYPVRVAHQTVEAWQALERAIIRVGYRTPMGPTGSYTCRTIGGSTTMSLHAYGIAVDWDYGENPHLRRDNPDPVRRGFGLDPRFRLTEAHIDAVEAIVNSNGDPIFKWLGWGPEDGGINDTMHFEIDQPPHLCQPNEEETMELSDAAWFNTLRDEDIERFARPWKIITDEEVLYYQDNPAMEDVTNLRRAWDVRRPLWETP